MSKMREEGKAAFLEGRPKRGNPYRRFTAAWFEWLQGYVWAFTNYGDGAVIALNPVARKFAVRLSGAKLFRTKLNDLSIFPTVLGVDYERDTC